MSDAIGLGANVGTAWVSLRFSARGAASQIRTQLQAEGELAGVTMGEGASKKFGSTFSRGLSKVGGLVSKAILPVSAAIGVIGYESVKSATTFQTSMLRIRTQAGASQSEVNKMSKAVLNMANAQQGPQELAAALFHLESLGLRSSKAISALKTSMALASVSGADLEQASSAIGGAWRTGIVGAKSFSQSAGTLNAIVGAGNMQMSDLLSALGTGILPAAKTFGLNLSQVGSALALFTDEGVPAVDAATRLRMTFSLLGAPSQLAEKQLQSIGITGLELANTMRGPDGLIGAIQLLKDHLDASGLSASMQAALLSRAFGGGRSSSAILSMLNNLSVLKKKQDQVNSSVGKFGDAVKAESTTSQAQWDIFKSTLDDMVIKLGRYIIPFTTNLIKSFNVDLLPLVGRVSREFETIIPVNKIKSAWTDLMRFLGVTQPDMRNVLPPAVVRPVSAPNDRAGVFQPQPVKKMVPFAPFGDRAGPIVSVTPIVKSVTNAFSSVDWGKIIGDGISAGVKDAGKIGAAVLSLIQRVDWSSLGKAAALDLVPFAVGLVDNFATALIDEAVHHPLDSLLFILSIIPVGKIAGLVGKLFGEIPIAGKFIVALTKPLEAAGNVVQKYLFKILRFIFSPVLDRIEPYFAGAKSWLISKGLDIIYSLWYGIEHGWSPIGKFLSGIPGKILGFFGDAGRWLFAAGGNLIDGLLNGIKDMMAGIGGWIKSNVVDPIIGAVKNFFGIHSPSTVMHSIGFNLIAGLVRGIVAHNPIPAIKNVFGSLPDALGHLVEKGMVSISSLPGRALNVLSSLGGKLGGFFGGVLDKLFGGGASSGVKQWTSTVSKALSMLGLPQSLLGNVLYQMQTESGGNANAINLTDINAQNGDPSRGLMQVIGSTFAAYHVAGTSDDIYNPLANIAAALNYARSRYGPTLMSGGMGIGSGHGYDSGGVARGLGLMPKYTIKPERVLSPRQTSAFERLVDVLDGRSGGSAKPCRQRIEFDPSTMEMWIRDISSQEAGDEIDFRNR